MGVTILLPLISHAADSSPGSGAVRRDRGVVKQLRDTWSAHPDWGTLTSIS